MATNQPQSQGNGNTISPQIFVGLRPTSDKVDPIKNTDCQYNKPAGGIWTSPMRDGSSPWLDHLNSASGRGLAGDNDDIYKLTPSDDVDLFVIDSKNDLDDLLDQYKRDDIDTFFTPDCAPIDFQQLAQDYDGLTITWNGIKQTSHLTPGMYTWDVPSTVWFGWPFDNVQQVESV